MEGATLDLEEVASRASRILDEVERAVAGKRSTLEPALCAPLADGHVPIEDYPGLAETQAALPEAMQERRVTIEETTRALTRASFITVSVPRGLAPTPTAARAEPEQVVRERLAAVPVPATEEDRRS